MRKIPRYKDQLRKSRKQHLKQKVLIVVSLAVVLLAGLLYLLFFARLLDVRAVNVQSDNEASEIKEVIVKESNTWLDEKKYFMQRRRNIFIADTEELEALLGKRVAKIDSVAISRDLPHTLGIKITERTPHGIWCRSKPESLSEENSECFYFSNKGIIYESAPQTTGFLVLKVADERNQEVDLGEIVFDERWVQAIDYAYEKLPQKNFKIRSVVVPTDSIDDFYVLTSENLKIYLNINTNILGQIDAMAAFISQKLSKDKLAGLQYFDLRIQDRIYYK